VIRQKETSDDTYEALMAFCKQNRKVPITVKDFPGFAINPVFISSYMVLDSFLAEGYNVATLESISQEALGVKFGIMWVQNGSGLGTCYHAAASMFDYLADTDVGYPAVPPVIKAQLDSGQPWNLKDGPVNEDAAARLRVKERLLGSIFAISSHLIEKDVVTVDDLELGIRTALAWPKGPFGLMNEMGMEEAARLIGLAVDAGYFKMPARFDGKLPEAWVLAE
jgi:3-hydroxyacyl-CoA dehydrogenase